MTLAAFIRKTQLFDVDVSKSDLFRQYNELVEEAWDDYYRNGSDDYENIDGISYLRYAAAKCPEEIYLHDEMDIDKEMRVAENTLVVALEERNEEAARRAAADLAVAWTLESRTELTELDASDVELPFRSEWDGTDLGLLQLFRNVIDEGECEEFDWELGERQFEARFAQDVKIWARRCYLPGSPVGELMSQGYGRDAAEFLALSPAELDQRTIKARQYEEVS